MGGFTFSKSYAVTAIEVDKGQVVLLGIGGSTHDRRITHNESLLNSHHMRDYGVIVEDTSNKHCGNQCLIILDTGRSIIIPLVFDGGIIKINLQKPTEEDLFALSVNWLTPAMVEHSTRSIKKNITVMQAFHIIDKLIPEEYQEV